MLPNFVLTGFMGCGKSSVGRRLAALTGHRFVDTDDLIVESTGLAISDIFTERGEAGFREIESATLRELVGVSGIVLATGGGIVLRPENQEVLRQIGFVTWLHAHPDILFERVSRNRRRPLLQTENPRQTFDDLLALRLPIYEAASTFCVDSSDLTHDQTAHVILDQYLRSRSAGIPPG